MSAAPAGIAAVLATTIVRSAEKNADDPSAADRSALSMK